MADDNVIYEPRKLFDSELKQKFHDNADAYFENLVKQSGVDVEANRQHVAEYKKLQNEKKGNDKSLNKWKSLATFLIFLIMVAVTAIVIFVFVYLRTSSIVALIVGEILSIGALIGFILIYVKVIKPKIKVFGSIGDTLSNKLSKKQDECEQDLVALNALYDWNIPNKIMRQTTPIIELDDNFTPQRLNCLQKKFGALTEIDPDQSTLSILSGSIQGNPFVLQKVRNHHMGEKTYVGHLTITWTTTVRTKDGIRTVPHTQVLTASVRRPCPFYGTHTRLIYGNEAAPDLVFSRSPQHADSMDAKKRQKFVQEQEKQMQQLQEKTVASKRSFNPLANSEFEAYLNAYNRSNEVQYRLLFTPLAQKNFIDLLTNPEPYGDDFSMVKDHMVTSVASIHSQLINYVVHPAVFINDDIDLAKKNFLEICDQFFQGLYFDLVPILSIPEYQLHKPFEEIYKDVIHCNVSYHETEAMANSIDKKYFMPKKADPSLPLIIKPKHISPKGKSDVSTLHCFSYMTTPQVDLIPRLGGDGIIHPVPVHWIRYDKVEQDFQMLSSPIGGNSSQFYGKFKEGPLSKYLKSVRNDQGSFQRGLFAAALVGGLTFTDGERKIFDSLFTTENAK